MINKETCKIKISEEEAKKKAAYKSKDAVYDKEKGELTFIVNHVSKKGFHLVYDNKIVRALVEGQDDTITSTLHTVEEFETEEEALDWIQTLGLEYEPSENIE